VREKHKGKGKVIPGFSTKDIDGTEVWLHAFMILVLDEVSGQLHVVTVLFLYLLNITLGGFRVCLGDSV
jgi:hypothetical protein